ncbi:MAG TPA: S1 RNA-binding domain-containing protein [Deltaproteobacteria bacterium]|nr:S1 RNA-binding domain-containing protein [Deltaproteobacteria bacterium]
MEKEKSFAELLNESELRPRHYSVGEKIEAAIVNITPEWIFLDLGAKSEGYLDRKELIGEDGNLTVKEGDVISAYFLHSRQGEKLFTTKLLTRKSVDDYLYSAYKNQIPLEATVEKEIKGGFAVKISATAEGFCPYSQMEIRKADEPSAYIGKNFDFVIIEYSERGRKIVVSRRPLLEKIQKEKIDVLKTSLTKGMKVSGTVTAVQNFGAFVDIGGMQALLPVSEMAWGRSDAKALYMPGDKIEAVILNLDWENNRVSLSVKDTLPDPWANAVAQYPEGSVHTGKVSRLTEFGAFVTLEDGVDGLLHISKLARGKKIKHARDVLAEGAPVEVRVEKVDLGSKKISLDLAANEEETKAAAEETEETKSFIGKAPQTMGTLSHVFEKYNKKK